MAPAKDTVIARLEEIIGKDNVLTDAQSLQTYGKDWTRVYTPDPLAILFPRSINDVQDIVQFANQKMLSLVPSGGRTGLSGGAMATGKELVVSFEKMNKILHFNPLDRQVICESGVITKQLQDFAEGKNLFYPVDFASSGSSQMGGNAATNAGGIKVIKHGLTRDQITGMKVVTGKGDLLDLNQGLTKNATGYDFRHLFIGSEGTLGFIVELTIRLSNLPKDPTVLVLAVEELDAIMEVLRVFQQKVDLTAFEFFSEKALVHVIAEKDLQRPFETISQYYALIEFENDNGSAMDCALELFERCMEEGLVCDGTISQNTTQARSLWRLREDISETISLFTPYKNDISVVVSKIPDFLREVDQLVNEKYPEFEIIWFGHIGDGNVHLNILKPNNMDNDSFFSQCSTVSELVFQIVQRYGGSVAAEHGVGLLKKSWLPYTRSDAEIQYMKAIKTTFDPNNIMNPGKIFD